MEKSFNFEDATIMEKIDVFILLMNKKCPPEKKEEVEPLLKELVSLKRDLMIVKEELKTTKLFVAEGPLSILEKAQKIQEFIAYHKNISADIRDTIKEVIEYVK